MAKPQTVWDIVNDVHKQMHERLTQQELEDFFLTEWNGEKLTKYHHTLGRWIRNEFSLWSIPWVPEIREDGCDYSPFHPDQVSQTIIEEVWKKGLKNATGTE